jgi:hypothetical protein
MKILLSHLKPLASGNNRDVFVHPHDPNLLIKTIKADASSRKASWKKRFRRYGRYEQFSRECHEHIVGRLNCYPPDFVHQVVGFVDTDRGLGLVTRAEKDQNGNYAPTLANLIISGDYDEKAQKAMQHFLSSFIDSNIIITDLGHGNLVYAYKEDIGYHFVAIDGFGEKNLIPFNSLSSWCHMRSKKKRVIRLQNSIARAIARSREQQQSS